MVSSILNVYFRAQGVDDHIFLSPDAAAMAGIVEAVFGEICGSAAAEALMNAYLYSQQTRTSTNNFLFQAAGQFLDKFGRLPDWTPASQKQ